MCSVVSSETATVVGQRFFGVLCGALGVYWTHNILASFFLSSFIRSVSLRIRCATGEILAALNVAFGIDGVQR